MIHWPYDKIVAFVRRNGFKPNEIREVHIEGTVHVTTKDLKGAWPLKDLIDEEIADETLKDELRLIAADEDWRRRQRQQ